MLTFINCIGFHTNNCGPTLAPPCTLMYHTHTHTHTHTEQKTSGRMCTSLVLKAVLALTSEGWEQEGVARGEALPLREMGVLKTINKQSIYNLRKIFKNKELKYSSL